MSIFKFLALVMLLLCLTSTAFAVHINEIRIDQPSTDNDEYVELAGAPGEPLDGLFYLVIGDLATAPRCGGIECVVDLTGMTIQADGLLAIGDIATSGLHTYVYDVEADLNFENSDNLTHLIVTGFYGASGEDVDLDDDCVIDPIAPWLATLDMVAMWEGTEPDCLGSDECVYGPVIVGPDGLYVPGHIYLCEDGWCIGDFALGVNDSPGEPNICCENLIDQWVSISGDEPDGTCVNFGTGFPSSPPLPADFFGPGSDPFEGQICLQGEPLGTTEWGDFDVSDTLIERCGDPFDPAEPPGPDLREVHTEILALNLISTTPITVTYFGGQFPEEWEVRMALSENGTSEGTITATKTHDNGGTFDSVLLVQPRYTLTRISDGFELTLDTHDIGLPPFEFEILDAPWVHAVEPSLHVITLNDGRFVPGVEEMAPGDPLSQELHRVYANELSGAASHTLFPPTSPPSATPPETEVGFALRAWPNPFNPSTQIEYRLPAPGALLIQIYDARGTCVRTVLDEVVARNHGSVSWDGSDDSGRQVASGVYFGRARSAGDTAVCKLMLVE
ncbi:MAG: FlgD immunoglobulin-like domain containing protein [bacterium]